MIIELGDSRPMLDSTLRAESDPKEGVPECLDREAMTLKCSELRSLNIYQGLERWLRG